MEELMLAMPGLPGVVGLLELHWTRGDAVTFSVAPDEVVPIAMNWVVSPGAATD